MVRIERLQRDVGQAREAFWRRYTPEQDKQRTNVHYERPPRFFTAITGGDWNVYSCNLWEGATNETESQERKLDLLAHRMQLQPGQRILDVGCGWGGPLVYLAKRYGVRGVGLTLSPLQKDYAERRISDHEAPAEVVECHWQDYRDPEPFDAIYTDEVIVHFNDLGGYFQKVKTLLKPGGRMLNKELHLASSTFTDVNRASVFVNEIYGETGNYRTLHEELSLADEAGFIQESVTQIDKSNYRMTLDSWEQNLLRHRVELDELVGPEYVRRFRTYLKIAKMIVQRVMTLDVVVSRSPA